MGCCDGRGGGGFVCVCVFLVAVAVVFVVGVVSRVVLIAVCASLVYSLSIQVERCSKSSKV